MPLPPPQTKEFLDRLVALATECRAELESATQSLQEIALLINQSRGEVERYTQREMQLANRVREMEANLESYARGDIRDMYHAAHEVELRLMIMRSQVEQLEEREKSIRAYQEKLRLLIELAESQTQAAAEREAASDKRTRLLRRGESSGRGQVPYAEIIEAREDERLRVAQQLVSGPAQMLANILMVAEICQQLIERDPELALRELGELRDTAQKALRDTRVMLYELRPLVLRELGIVATLRRYAAEIGRLTGVKINVAGPESDERLPEVLQAPLYRLIQQMMSTLARCDDASRVDVDLRYEDAQVVARIEGRGEGIERRQAIPGLLRDETLTRRLEQLDADLQTDLATDGLARLTLVIPLG